MSTTLEKSIVVDRPVSWVYDQWTQLEDFERYAPGVSRVEQLGPARIRASVKKRGVTREWDAVITEQIPDARIAWASERWLAADDADGEEGSEGPEHAGVVTFHQLDDEHTKVMLQFDFKPHGFLEWYADGAGLVRGWVDDVLDDFKAFVEDRQRPTGAWRGTIRDGQVVDDGDGDARTGSGTTRASSAGEPDDTFTAHDLDTLQPPTGGSTAASTTDTEADRASGPRTMADGEIRTT